MTAPVVDHAASDRSPVLDDRALFGHPRGLGLLFVAEMWERFSYYGMRALLILYLVQSLKWSTKDAANLYGTYTALAFLTPIIGGYLADRWIGTRRSLVIGAIIISLGHFTLALSSMATFYVGLALIIAGTGFFKPNVSTMVGQIYKEGDERRDGGFTIFYMGINTGAFLGPLVCGWLAADPRFGWHWGFAAAGVGMVLGLISYLWGRDRYLPGIGLGTARARSQAAVAAAPLATGDSKSLAHALGGAVAGGLLAWWGLGPNPLGILMAVIVGAAVALTVLGSHGDERLRVIALFIVVFFVIIFWTAYEQAGSSLNLFAANNTNLDVAGYKVPAAWYQSVNPAVILLFAPVFAALWPWLAPRKWEPSTAMKMVIGLFLLGIGFLFMVAGGRRADTGVLVSPFWLIAAYTFHTWGELCVSPVGLSYVTKVAPLRFASVLMGVWFLSNTVANKIAGLLAAYTPTPGQPPEAPATGLAGMLQHVSATNAGFYMIFVVAAFGAGAVMLLFVPLLKRLTSSVKA